MSHSQTIAFIILPSVLTSLNYNLLVIFFFLFTQPTFDKVQFSSVKHSLTQEGNCEINPKQNVVKF